jgi:biotin operon repressor
MKAETPHEFGKGLAVLAHFKAQLVLLGDWKTLKLLEKFEGLPFTNGEARQILEMKRQTAWKHLARLRDAGLIEKRGHTYRVSMFSRSFVGRLSATLGGTLMGIEPVQTDALKEVLKVASEGVELLYARGRIGEQEYIGYRSRVEELTG